MPATIIGPNVLGGGVLEWVILEESGDATTQEWELPVGDYMSFGHTVLVQSNILAGSGTVQPLLSTVSGQTAADGPGYIIEAETAETNTRTGDYRNFNAAGRGFIFGTTRRSVDTLVTRTRVHVKAGAAL